ncbi:MAG TPA: secretin and TonB N-terminal domain-containing protein, partial [Candidatus Marinimicrobia bacterium]|nr:secretin and TonB N-terminal domain-containing protein [Candidatus Neomarinimicrobiota bacterium]
LYQYGITIPRNSNQKEINKILQLKMDFNRVPDYLVKIEPPKGKNKKHKLKVTWVKNKKKKSPRYNQPQTNRLPESRVSLNFQAAKLVNVVRMLVSQDNYNLIMGEEVQGEVTMNLNDVSLETALDGILHVNNYEWFMQDNIIVVQPMTTKQTMSGELMTRMFRLNYTTGTMISEAVKEVLTPRGKIKALSSTASTNVEPGEKDILMVTDMPTNFALIEGVIRSLDIQTEQINIAVKFIETTLRHDEIIGVDWDMRESMSLINSGADTSNSFDLGYLMMGDQTMNFATLSKPVVSAILSLLANDGSTKLLQEPQVTTMNNSPANILVGTTIPLLVPQGEGSVFGTNPYTYEDQHVNVSLDVLPRVNQEKIISMKIDAVVQAIIGFVGKDQRPMISTRSTNTSVRVKHGETLLIGGLIFDTDQEIVSKVPLLGDIPLIKYLFRSSNKNREQRELLIFITPTVISNDT